MKKILYMDMDNVLVNFQSGLDKIDPQTQSKFNDKNDEIPGIFSLMEPVDGAIEAQYCWNDRIPRTFLH